MIKLMESSNRDEYINATARYLLDEADISINSWGNISNMDIPTFRDVVEDFDDRITKQDYFKAVAIVQGLKDLPLYDNDGIFYIELSDNHTLWNINNDDLSGDAYNELVADAVDEFENMTGTDVFLLGRSGRHVCVDLNIDNIKNYDKLIDIQDKLENDVIAKANSY